MTTLSYNASARALGPSQSGKNWLIYAMLLAGILALSVLLGRQLLQPPPAPVTSAATTPPLTQTIQAPIRQQEETAGQSAPKPKVVDPHTARPASLSQARERAFVDARKTEYTEGLILWLQQMISTDATITPAEAQAVHEVMQRIINQGTAAVPAIRQFLQSQKDFVFYDAKGGEDLVDYSSLRVALMEALGTIGGPEAEAILFEVLETTAEPAEVTTAARFLEFQAPGYYHEPIRGAARRSLAVVAQGPAPDEALLPGAMKDAAPLFKMFQESGDETVAEEVARVLPWYEYYATITLGKLPDSQGIPILIRLAQSFTTPHNRRDQLALHMLAQVAVDNPDAREALLEKVRTNEIPVELWPRVTEVVAGNRQLQIEQPDPSVETGSNISIHTVTGRRIQNIYSVDRSAVLSPEEFNQRSDLLNQMATETSDPVALQALNDASSLLLGQKR